MGVSAVPATGVDTSVPRSIRVGDLEVAFVDLLPGAVAAVESNEPPLVLVHGFTGHRDDFIGVAPFFAQQRRVLIPDLRGHGNSSVNPGALGWSFEQLVEDLEAFLGALEVERCDLLGHSLGGMVALRYALRFPERLRSLVLMCTAPEAPALLSRDRLIKAADLADSMGMARLQELTEKATRPNASRCIQGWGERYWSHQRRRILAMTPASYRGIGMELFDAPSQVARLGEVVLPTLVLVGEDDKEFMAGADLFEAHLPNAHRLTLEHAEHHPHQENSDAFLKAMAEHFGRVD